MYEYMVVYAHPQGTGRCFVTRDTPVTSREDIQRLDGLVKDLNPALPQVLVTNVVLLSGPKTIDV